MLIMTLEGGMVGSIMSDDPDLIAWLNRDGVAVIDYDTDGTDAADLVSVKFLTVPGQPVFVKQAAGHLEEVGLTLIDTANLMQVLGEK